MIHINLSEAKAKIAIIIGSTRPSRICPEIARWVLESMQETGLLSPEVIDLAQINLPFLDEPIMAALDQYEHEHTKKWSALVSSYAGFVFVLPQYNWGYPAPLKNALDYLYKEWHGKAATIVTYGNHGGHRAAAQLQTVLQGLHMKNTPTNPQLTITSSMFDPLGRFTNIDADFAGYKTQIQTAAAELAEMTKPIIA